MTKSNIQLKRYTKVYGSSGCVSANYNINNKDSMISLVEDKGSEFSGQSKFNKNKR